MIQCLRRATHIFEKLPEGLAINSLIDFCSLLGIGVFQEICRVQPIIKAIVPRSVSSN
jgi:hypothetical protein